jgi:hypothetical protein
MVRNHPAIGEIHIFLKLHRDHLGIHLNDGPSQPIANPVSIHIVITKHLNAIPDLKGALLIWSFGKKQTGQSCLLKLLKIQ